jgi:hypothetical protein
VKSVAAALLALALGLGGAGCGGRQDGAERALAQASDRLADLRSGRIAVSAHVDQVGPGRSVDVHAHGSFTVAGPEQALVAELVHEGTRRDVQADASLRAVRLEDWVARPEREPGLAVDGATTVHVHGRLVAPAAFEDLRALGLTAPFGAREVRSGWVDLWVGRRDHILRRLRVIADVGLQLPEGLAAALPRTVGATVWLELDLTHLRVRSEGGPVTVLP